MVPKPVSQGKASMFQKKKKKKKKKSTSVKSWEATLSETCQRFVTRRVHTLISEEDKESTHSILIQ